MIAMLLLQSQQVTHEFQYVADAGTTRVNVAGTFNNWNKDANPMKIGSDGKTYTLKVSLPYGKHQYKFVLNGETWITDPKAEKNENDGGGNVNSLVFILVSPYNGEICG